MQNDNQAAIKEMLKSFAYLLDEAMKKTTKIYDGVVVSTTTIPNKWNIKYNNEVHAVKLYGSGDPSINSIVKVFIPQGNQSLAWFMSTTKDIGQLNYNSTAVGVLPVVVQGAASSSIDVSALVLTSSAVGQL